MDTATDSGLRPPAGRNPAVTPTKRPLSDTFTGLAPSPQFRESGTAARDDNAILEDTDTPRTPRRSSFLARGLSLQMPHKTPTMTTPSQNGARTPLSPQLDPAMTYGSPATSLPRHSRGLDFSRASTNLHHSTLAESSPDSSPIITQRSLNIPSRKGSINSMMLDSPNLGPAGAWPALLSTERSAVSSSVGSVNMLGSPTGSSESDDEDLTDEAADEVMSTPQVNRTNGQHAQATPYNPSTMPVTPGAAPSGWSNNFSPATASLMKNFRQGRFRRGRSRKSSSSASGTSAIPSPRASSPPPSQAVVRSIESATNNNYFGWPKFSSSRRESLALGTDNLHLSSSNDSGDENGISPSSTAAAATPTVQAGQSQSTPRQPTTPGVVRRAVTRRSNLLPKTKGFARIRAALAEEGAPVDTEVRREAETIKQINERSDAPSSSGRSPGLMPTVPGVGDGLEDIPELGSDVDGTDSGPGNGVPGSDDKGLNACFSTTAAQHANTTYWDRLDKSFRTPPPPTSLARNGSTVSDVNMDSPTAIASHSASLGGDGSIFPGNGTNGLHGSTNSSQDAILPASEPAPLPPVLTKTIGKRARDEDVDIMSIKRRAVSPSLSVTNSPVVGQSPARNNGSNAERDRDRDKDRERDSLSQTQSLGQSQSQSQSWGAPPKGRENSAGEMAGLQPHRSNSGGSVSSMASGVAAVNGTAGQQGQQQQGGVKRVGMQSMTDTNDGLMKMCLE